jgi:TonB-dependent receptor-like protein
VALGALLAPSVCAAQEPPQAVPPPSSVPPQQDTTGEDTSGVARGAKADSIKALYHPDTTRSRAPLAHAPVPPLLEPGQGYRWDRAAIDASGALVLADLLDKVPGFTSFRAGWLSTPMNGAYLGDIAHVRVFVDGIELDPLDSRLHGNVDLATIQLWEFEEVAVERGASELRVYCRTIRANRTTPATRADVFTGNLQTNLYKAYYGQRFGPGFATQVGAYQYNNTGSFGGGGNQSSIYVRVGYASGPFSIDVFGNRYTRGRDQLQTGDPTLPILILPDLESQRTDAYFRVGLGDPDRGRPWLQVIASSMEFKNTSPTTTQPLITDTTTVFQTTPSTSIDSITTESQYIVSGGVVFAGIRFSGTDRYRVFSTHGNYNSLEARASWDTPILSASGLVQRDAFSEGRPDSVFTTQLSPTLYNSYELAARFSPLPFVRFVGTASRVTPENLPAYLSATTTTARAEAGLRLKSDLWLSGGVMTKDTSIVSAPVVYDTTDRTAAYGRTTAMIASLSGNLFGDIYVNLSGTDWNKAEPYLPKYVGHAEAYLETEWPKQFPRHTFAIKLGVAFDYRSSAMFPSDSAPNRQYYTVADSRVYSVLAEIRILQGVISWQLRNANGYPYYLVPGYQMPRQVNIYGLRWSFWN